MIYLIITFLTLILLYIYFLKKETFQSNINNTLDRIYIINLDRSPDRWKFIKKQCKKSGLNINRFCGTDGAYIDKKSLIKNGILSPSNKMNNGLIGCALSHLNLWNKISKDKNKISLLLEDDVLIPKDFRTKYLKIQKYFPENWDVIFLGGCNIYGKKINEHIIKPLHKNGGNHNICLHAVLIKNNSAKKLLNCCLPLRESIDIQLMKQYSKINVYYANPLMIFQNKDMDSIRRIISGQPKKASKIWLDYKQSRVITI